MAGGDPWPPTRRTALQRFRDSPRQRAVDGLDLRLEVRTVLLGRSMLLLGEDANQRVLDGAGTFDDGLVAPADVVAGQAAGLCPDLVHLPPKGIDHLYLVLETSAQPVGLRRGTVDLDGSTFEFAVSRSCSA